MRKKILLRFDDICPTMNWEQWGRAKKLLDEVGATALLGVIPNCKDPDLMIDEPKEDFWEYIRKLQSEGFTIAMHGLHHVFDSPVRGLVNRGRKSEFAGHSYDEQFSRIKQGKEIFQSHGIRTNIFFAPAHSYDDNTLKALAANGFVFMSDGKSSKPYMRYGIKCLPVRDSGLGRILRQVGGAETMILHAHEWVRDDKKTGYDRLVKKMRNRDNQFMSFDGYKRLPCGIALIQRMDERLFVAYERHIEPFLVKVKHFASK